MGDWQPITTCPRDVNFRFIGVDARDALYWPCVYAFAWQTDQGPVWSCELESFTDELTHWQPLPKAPE